MPSTHHSLNSTDLHALAQYYQTHPIPHSFDAAVVVASILVSILGAATTLLLLGRRTATSGFRNWMLLFLAAITMASVGIWGMHFIGMSMVLRPSPDVAWHIQFNAGFTILSLFVPMLALAMVFVFVGTGPEALPDEGEEELADYNTTDSNVDPDVSSTTRKRPSSVLSFFKPIFSFINLRLAIGGILLGGTVALMHYSAGFSASFQRKYKTSYLLSSIALACVVSTAALVVFFRFQSQWQHNWWKRLMCAILLATGVCGMHYLGLSGTQWYVPLDRTEGFFLGEKSSTVLTIAISIMCFGVCVISLMITLSDFLVTRESRRKARRVVIASVIFDKTGRVLVNLDGMLPMSEVETDLPLKEITEELNYRQPTFQWLYALSCDWSIIDPFIPRIVARSLGLEGKDRKAWDGLSFAKKNKPGTSDASSKSAAQITLFKDRCLEATQILSTLLGVPMSKMGIFFDNVLRTGARVAPPSPESQKGRVVHNDEESSIFSVTVPVQRQQGIMLFLVRELSNPEDSPEHYLRRGFRFADPRWLSPILADRAGVPKIEIDGLLDHLKLYARRGMKPCVRSGGSYVGFFAVRPSISRQGGVDTLVYQFARHQIPAYRLPDVAVITDEMRAWVVSMSGLSMKEVGELCTKDANKNVNIPGRQAEDMWIFKSSLILAIDAMVKNLSMLPKLAEKSFLSAEIIEVPSSDDDSKSTASMVIFQAAFPAPFRHGHELPGLNIPHEVSGTYQTVEPTPTFTFMPYSFFSKSQMMLLKGSNARKFAKECRTDLIKRYPVSAESLHTYPYLTSPQDRKTAYMDPMMAGSTRPEHALIQSKYMTDERYEDVYTDLMSRYGDLRATPAQSDVKSGPRRASGMSSKTTDFSLVSVLHTIGFDEPPKPIIEYVSDPMYDGSKDGFPFNAPSVEPRSATSVIFPFGMTGGKPDSDGVAAPAYSPIRATHGLESRAKPDGILKHSQRPRTADDTQAQRKAMRIHHSSRVVRPATANATPSGSHSVGDFPFRPPPPSFRSLQPYSSSHVLCAPLPKPVAQPLATTARLRSDDWASRCLDGLEHSPAGQELFGVEW